MLEFVKKMLEYASGKKGVSYGKMQEYCKLYASDKRYVPCLSASTVSWNYNQTGIIKYRGVRYYYRQNGINSVLVEIY